MTQQPKLSKAKAQREDTLLVTEDTEQVENNHQTSKNNYPAPSLVESLQTLATVLHHPELKQDDFVYIANISVRATKQQVLELLQPLGELLAFEFVIRDKMFRFQAGLAVYKKASAVLEDLKSKPLVLFKRKLRIYELSSRNNSSTLLAILAKKVIASTNEKEGSDDQSNHPRKPSSVATASDQETQSKKVSAKVSSQNPDERTVVDSVFANQDSYVSKMKDTESKLRHTAENLRFRDMKRPATHYYATWTSKQAAQDLNQGAPSITGAVAARPSNPSSLWSNSTQIRGLTGYKLF